MYYLWEGVQKIVKMFIPLSIFNQEVFGFGWVKWWVGCLAKLATRLCLLIEMVEQRRPSQESQLPSLRCFSSCRGWWQTLQWQLVVVGIRWWWSLSCLPHGGGGGLGFCGCRVGVWLVLFRGSCSLVVYNSSSFLVSLLILLHYYDGFMMVVGKMW